MRLALFFLIAIWCKPAAYFLSPPSPSSHFLGLLYLLLLPLASLPTSAFIHLRPSPHTYIFSAPPSTLLPAPARC
ncbi:hypothetical protein C8J57DRAFT_1273713 [Mycena rebaudengoi]|nr:hypothetical protein C8J57DRAFT_1273713 [Mycena rebaudengoi]